MKRVFVDTGAWYALVDADDPDHARVATCFREYRGRLVTSNYVFDEIITLTRYRLGWEVASRLGDQLRANRVAQMEPITPQDEDTAWTIFSRYRDKSFSFTDCTSFAFVKRAGIALCLAIDGDFRAYGLHCVPELD
ncbi:PIN domain-containing protein [uncultured Thiodictyon sp.]|uniref:type II toxin-antitoxin system VapC family toxin n=1 Tax=uncultured Thiodictyon sp. TaxID=1846217 RepID=UPI0025E8DC4A|nr:PIN domain-containing protein [uncultured Thiodictyon sp.]